MAIKKLIRDLFPPIAIKIMRAISRQFTKQQMEYACLGWETQLKNTGVNGWNSNKVLEAEKAKWEAFCANREGSGPLGFSHESKDLSIVRDVSFHNIHMTYAYVLALAAHKKDRVSILDWGGGLGHYYQIAKAVLPEVTFDFHCKEVETLVNAGRQINPQVHWYADDSYLKKEYDLVMVNGSLQYIKDWQELLMRLFGITKDYFFLTRLPVIERAASYVAIQRIYGTELLHQQFNQNDVLRLFRESGLNLVREFVVGDRPYIKGAPEPCELKGWLFKKRINE